MRDRITTIIEQWFIRERALFQVICTHDLVANSEMDCPIRSGKRRIEYNPARAHDYSVDKPSLREITPGHYIHCNDAEFAQYQKELGLQ